MLHVVKVRRVVARLGLGSGLECAFVLGLFSVALAACSVSVVRARPEGGVDAGSGGN